MAKARAPRRKRASATQLYQTCKASGTCPSDVIPKVEGTTIADQILRWGSMGVFFGGLGIGTGSGTGGRTGYIPLGRPSTTLEPGPVVRPAGAVETVAPSDPSIVSLVEESSVVDVGAPTPTIPTHGGFEITTSSDATPAILDVTSTTTPIRVSVTSHNNPIYTEPSLLDPPPPVQMDGRVLVSTSTLPSSTAEHIPMDTFIIMQDHIGTTTSTPVPRPPARPRLVLYSRALQQVPVHDPAFLQQPSSLITYNNPVYEGNPDVTLHFEQPTIHNAPDPAFMDIFALHRPALTTRRGVVRYSRVGERATVHTRSGLQLKPRVHYFQDLSPIAHVPEEIELHPLISANNTSINNGLYSDIYDVYADTDFADTGGVSTSTVSRSSIHTTLQTTSIPSRYGNTTVPLTASSPYTPIPTSFRPSSGQAPFIPARPIFPQTPIAVNGGDFYLHPSYTSLRKRRKRLPYFLADGYVAA
uniref:Minor capsid protein L2 n=1 Tax=Human papillomavirus type 54 TaxID=1671798 RepID=A0A0P0EGZ5_HPV54|nr:late protein L2 [Human papillomavirus type 54]